jgi:hypothetical protein
MATTINIMQTSEIRSVRFAPQVDVHDAHVLAGGAKKAPKKAPKKRKSPKKAPKKAPKKRKSPKKAPKKAPKKRKSPKKAPAYALEPRTMRPVMGLRAPLADPKAQMAFGREDVKCMLWQQHLHALVSFVKGSDVSNDEMLSRFGARLGTPGWVCAEVQKLFKGSIIAHLRITSITKSSAAVLAIKGKDMSAGGRGEDREARMVRGRGGANMPPAFQVERSAPGLGDTTLVLLRRKWCGISVKNKKLKGSAVAKMLSLLDRILPCASKGKRSKECANRNAVCDIIQRLLPKTCLAKKGWRINGVLGAGEFGLTFSVERATGKQRRAALKVVAIPEDGGDAWITVEDEVAMQRKFHRAGLAPPVLCHDETTINGVEVHVVLMGAIDMVFSDWLGQKFPGEEEGLVGAKDPLLNPKAGFAPAMERALRDLFVRMAQHRLTHGDMHGENIGLVVDPKTLKMHMEFIDFGAASQGPRSYSRADAAQLLAGTRVHMNNRADTERLNKRDTARFAWLRGVTDRILTQIFKKKPIKNKEITAEGYADLINRYGDIAGM